MPDQYVTIWSKSGEYGRWVIERTHSLEYAKVIMGKVEIKEIVIMPNGKYYAIFPENINPNQA